MPGHPNLRPSHVSPSIRHPYPCAQSETEEHLSNTQHRLVSSGSSNRFGTRRRMGASSNLSLRLPQTACSHIPGPKGEMSRSGACSRHGCQILRVKTRQSIVFASADPSQSPAVKTEQTLSPTRWMSGDQSACHVSKHHVPGTSDPSAVPEWSSCKISVVGMDSNFPCRTSTMEAGCHMLSRTYIMTSLLLLAFHCSRLTLLSN